MEDWLGVLGHAGVVDSKAAPRTGLLLVNPGHQLVTTELELDGAQAAWYGDGMLDLFSCVTTSSMRPGENGQDLPQQSKLSHQPLYLTEPSCGLVGKMLQAIIPKFHLSNSLRIFL
jgi:hypothetical protein